MVFLTIFTLLLLFLSYRIYLLRRVLVAARQTGLPYVIRPHPQDSSLYIFLLPYLQLAVDHLPHCITSRMGVRNSPRFYQKEWRFKAKYKLHEKLGSIYLMVAPGELSLEVADPSVYLQVTDRRNDFLKNTRKYAALRLFGRNLIETEGETWKRHRRAVAPQFNDSMNAFVWNQSTNMGKEMLSEWKQAEDPDAIYKAPHTTREARDLTILTHRIMTATMFNTPLRFDRSGASPENLEISAISTSMQCMVANILFEVMVPRSLWSSIPGFTHVGKAGDHLDSYFEGLVSGKYRSKVQKRNSKSPMKSGVLDWLLSALAPQGVVPSSDQLSAGDVMGNIFAVTLAGTGTTADSMHYSLIMLALHPEVQSWVVEELDRVVKECDQEWTYMKVYPKLPRLLCLMMETLRLFPGVIMIPKVSTSTPQTITHNNRTFTIPPNTSINLNVGGLHYNPAAWGPDAGEFRPSRWLSDDQKTIQSELVDGSYATFSRGSRKCLGKRFAEAESMAVISTILRECRIELAKEGPDETEEEARRRAWEILERSTSLFNLRVDGRLRLKFVGRA